MDTAWCRHGQYSGQAVELRNTYQAEKARHRGGVVSRPEPDVRDQVAARRRERAVGGFSGRFSSGVRHGLAKW